MLITKCVRRLEPYTPGEQPRSRNVVKLNTNENPYPPSPKCAKTLAAFDLDRLRRYPDPVFTELRKALAKLNGTRVENIFVGNGSDEILALAAKTFVEGDEAIGSLDPSYSLYKTIAAIRDVKWIGIERADLLANPAKAIPAKPKVSLMLLTNPNAPTGEFIEPRTVAKVAAGFHGVVIVDEAYADFARANCMKLATAKRNRNLIVMRTFSKSYSLAGLRVGYAVGPKTLIDALYKVKDSYNIDAVAQAVALAAVKDRAYFRATVRKVVAGRKFLTTELVRRGWDVLPSETNFVFAKPAHVPAAKIFAALRNRNIFVRYFKGPKTGDRLRITVGTMAQMEKLLKAIDELDLRK